MTNTRSTLGHRIRTASEPVRALLAELAPEDIALPFAVDVLDAFIELEKLAASGRVLMAARAAESDEWKRAGCPSPTAWLALRQGTDNGRARADLETSGRLGGLPKTADELRAGNLSPQQAGAVAEGASANPAAEQDLLDTAASDSLRHTREAAARRKAEVEAERSKVERERKVRAGRKAYCWTRNGRWCLYAEGPLDVGAQLQQALENRVGEIHRERRLGTREQREQYAFDALADLMGGSTRSGEPTTRQSVRRLMLVRVDLAALVHGTVGEGEVCEIPGVGPVSVDAARAMFGDSILRLITTNGTAVVDVVNPARKPTEAQRIAKLWTDPTCCVTGCNRTVDLEYEHREDYARTRHTVLVESEHMCTFHHRLKTLENWQLVAGTGRRAFVPPDDPRHPGSASSAEPGAPPGSPPGAPPGSPPGAPPAGPPDVVPPTDMTARIQRLRRIRATAERNAALDHGQGDLFGDTG